MGEKHAEGAENGETGIQTWVREPGLNDVWENL